MMVYLRTFVVGLSWRINELFRFWGQKVKWIDWAIDWLTEGVCSSEFSVLINNYEIWDFVDLLDDELLCVR